MLSRLTCMGGTPRAYDIVVGDGALQQLAEDLASWRGIPKSSSIVIVTDENVWKWHGRPLLSTLAKAGVRPEPIVKVLPPGEGSKTRATKEEIEDWMLANRCFRDTVMIAVGGGVVGDMTGYVAATYMRGVPVVQVPTTLLAMVDSSIGGKTGIDTLAGKNLIGAFHQPAGVYADTALLRTLPVRELVNGYGEVVKAGAIKDGVLFQLCEERAEELVGAPATVQAKVALASPRSPFPSSATVGGSAVDGGRPWSHVISYEVHATHPSAATTTSPPASMHREEPDDGQAVVDVPIRAFNGPLLSEVVTRSIAVKVGVVSADEREGGERAILNFGHTVGHGYEAQLQPGVLHGECVALGMVKEAEVARALGHCDSALVGRLKRCLKAVGLPTVTPAHLTAGPGLQAVMSAMSVDKKNTKTAGGTGERSADRDAGVVFKCVLLNGIGSVASPPFAHAVPGSLLRRVLSAAVTVVPGLRGCRVPASLHEGPPGVVHLRVPGSKSVSNRALLLAGLAAGTTRITGLLSSDDTQVMIGALKTLGARVAWDGATGDALVTGTGGTFATLPPGTTRIYVGNAGTASRFLTSVLCLLPSVSSERSVVLEGNARMAVRPIGPLVDALRAQGAAIAYTGKDGCPPLLVTRRADPGVDSSGSDCESVGAHGTGAGPGAAPTTLPPSPRRHRLVFLQGKVSSQYVSSVLMAAPLFPPFRGHGGSTVTGSGGVAAAGEAEEDDGCVELLLAEEHPTSLPYITMTLATMADFGVRVTRLADNRYLIPRTPYTCPQGANVPAETGGAAALGAPSASPAAFCGVNMGSVNSMDSTGVYEVEADASSASYAAAIAAVTGRTVVLEGVGSSSTQGDAGFPALLGRMGCTVVQSERSTVITGPPPDPDGVSGLVGIDVDMAEQTDCFMTLAAAAALASGVTRITGIANQRVKECNRIAAMVAEFSKLGVVARELPDGLEIEGKARAAALHGGTIHCYDDHRIAMSFGVLGTVVPGVVLDDAGCTEKTYPEFWDVLGSAFGYDVEAADAAENVPAVPEPTTPPRSSGPRSVIVIGMRGAGKSTLSAGAAAWLGCSDTHLPWRFIDLDVVLEDEATQEFAAAGRHLPPSGRVTVADVVAAEGWAGFRAREAAILDRHLAPGGPTATGCVISCGGGVVETEGARDALLRYIHSGGHVVEVRRHISDIQADLDRAGKTAAPAPAATARAPAGAGAAAIAPGITSPPSSSTDSLRPAYAGGATLGETFARRRGWYARCSSAVYAIPQGMADWRAVQHGFNALVERLAGAARVSGSSSRAGVLGAPGQYKGVPVVHRPLPLDGLRYPTPAVEAPSVEASGAPAAAAAVEAAAVSLGEGGDGSAFVCISLPDVRQLSTSWRTAAEAEAAAAAGSSSNTAPALPSSSAGLRQPTGDVWDELGDALFAVASGADAIELRVDLLRPPASVGADECSEEDEGVEEAFALYQLSLVRAGLRHGAGRHIAGKAPPSSPSFVEGTAAEGKGGSSDSDAFDGLFPLPPVIWTVRSAHEGGSFRGSPAAYARLVFLGVKAGCEVVDVEAGSGRWEVGGTLGPVLAAAAAAGTTVIGSVHWPALPQPSESELAQALARCRLGGAASVAKVVSAASSPAQALAFQAAAQRLHAHAHGSAGNVPLVSICMGEAGKLTRLTNDFLTPVTHEAFPTPAAPGQLILREVRSLRSALGLVPAGQRYVLTGTPIGASISPAMHAAAFALACLPHTYGRLESGSPAPLTEALRAGRVAGANVTIPLKQDVIDPATLDELSPEAAAIGAVNTVVAFHCSRAECATAGTGTAAAAPAAVAVTRGENTDWVGVALPLRAALARRAATVSAPQGRTNLPATALIVGAGGTAMAAAYAAARLGLAPVFVNRSHSKAADLAHRFGGSVVTPEELGAGSAPLPALSSLTVVVSTLPPSVGWVPPPWVLAATQPVVFDVAYVPSSTPLLAAAAAAGCETVSGRVMIVTQAAASSSLWTGKAVALLRQGLPRPATGSLSAPHELPGEDASLGACRIDLTTAATMARAALGASG